MMKPTTIALTLLILLIPDAAHALISWITPTANLEFSKTANIAVNVSGFVAGDVGKTVTFSVREGHTQGSGTVRQSANATVVSSPPPNNVANATLNNPMGGWPSQVGMQTPMHIEATWPSGGGTPNVEIQLINIAAD